MLIQNTQITTALPEQPLFIIGDVHGLANQLQKALNYAHTLHIPDLRIVFLGDLIDRGPDSLGCLQLVATARRIAPCSLLAGNHEQFMLAAIYGNDKANAIFNWRRSGGDWGRLVQVRKTLENLQLGLDAWHSNYRSGNCLCVHGGVPVNSSPEQLARFLSADLLALPKSNGSSFYHPLWLRRGFLESPDPIPGTFVCHGHTPSDFTGRALQGRLNLDGGSFRTGIVASALVQVDGSVAIHAWI